MTEFSAAAAAVAAPHHISNPRFALATLQGAEPASRDCQEEERDHSTVQGRTVFGWLELFIKQPAEGPRDGPNKRHTQNLNGTVNVEKRRQKPVKVSSSSGKHFCPVEIP